MKTIPLLMASLKGFIRNWKSILLLIVVPLVLISVIFLAFNPLGIQKTPIGVVCHGEQLNVNELRDYVSSFLDIREFSDLDSCLEDVRRYNQFVCMEILENESIILNVNFDNTRTPIIWEILARIEGSVDWLQKEKSRAMASELFDQIGSTTDKVDEFKTAINSTNSKIDEYILEIDLTIQKLQEAKNKLTNAMNEMDSEMRNVRSKKNNLQINSNNLYSRGRNYASNIEYYANNIPPADAYSEYALDYIDDRADELVDLFDDYSYEANMLLGEIDTKIDEYEDASLKGRQYMSEIDTYINILQSLKQDLITYKGKIGEAESEITNIQDKIATMEEMNPEVLINPIIVNNLPTYIPEVDSSLIERFAERFEDSSALEKAVLGLNMINLQTIFPMLLFLITIFLCLLVSSFICLEDINSSAHTRVSIIRSSFIAQFLSIYLSSLIVIFVPIV